MWTELLLALLTSNFQEIGTHSYQIQIYSAMKALDKFSFP
jgi:hypothetical protein